MPLCKKQRRDITCYKEHCDNSGDQVIGCGDRRENFGLPAEYRLYATESSEPEMMSTTIDRVNDIRNHNGGGEKSTHTEQRLTRASTLLVSASKRQRSKRNK